MADREDIMLSVARRTREAKACSEKINGLHLHYSQDVEQAKALIEITMVLTGIVSALALIAISPETPNLDELELQYKRLDQVIEIVDQVGTPTELA